MGKRENYHIFACASCGGPAKRTNRQAKFCDLCRLARQVAWHDLRPSTCGCGRRYIAWSGQRSSRMCGRCFIALAPLGTKDSVTAACRVKGCNEGAAQPVFHEALHLCYLHLDDPAMAKTLREVLPPVVAARRAAHNVVS